MNQINDLSGYQPAITDADLKKKVAGASDLFDLPIELFEARVPGGEILLLQNRRLNEKQKTVFLALQLNDPIEITTDPNANSGRRVIDGFTGNKIFVLAKRAGRVQLSSRLFIGPRGVEKFRAGTLAATTFVVPQVVFLDYSEFTGAKHGLTAKEVEEVKNEVLTSSTVTVWVAVRHPIRPFRCRGEACLALRSQRRAQRARRALSASRMTASDTLVRPPAAVRSTSGEDGRGGPRPYSRARTSRRARNRYSRARLKAKFPNVAIIFSLTKPIPPPGGVPFEFSTIRFRESFFQEKDQDQKGTLGIAPLDFLNQDSDDIGEIFLPAVRIDSTDKALLKTTLANIVAHEIAHLLGLVDRVFLGGETGTGPLDPQKSHNPDQNDKEIMDTGSKAKFATVSMTFRNGQGWNPTSHPKRNNNNIGYLQEILPK